MARVIRVSPFRTLAMAAPPSPAAAPSPKAANSPSPASRILSSLPSAPDGASYFQNLSRLAFESGDGDRERHRAVTCRIGAFG